MSKEQLFVMDPLSKIDPDHDTTYVILKELEGRGRDLWICQSEDLVYKNSNLGVKASKVRVKVDGQNYYRKLDESEKSIEEFELVWMREDPPFDLQYLHSTYLLEKSSTLVINSPRGIRDSNEKLITLDFPEHTPTTWVGARKEKLREFLEDIGGHGVGKTIESYGGESVFRLSLDDPNFNVIFEKLTQNESSPILVQEYLPQVEETGDRRVIVLGGDPIGAISRYPSDGDFRSNFHVGGEAGEVGIRDVEREVCKAIKPTLLDRGLHLVGLDFIGDYITEINVTSPTCVQEINEITGHKLESRIVDYALNLVQ